MIIKTIVMSINQAFIPWVYENIKSKNYLAIRKNYNLIFVMMFMLILMVVLLAPEIVTVLAPAEYLEAKFVIPPVAVSVFFILLYTTFANVEFYYEKK